MFGWFEKEEKEKHNHEWEIITKEMIYPVKKYSFSSLYETKTWEFDEKFIKMLEDKNISKEEIIAQLECNCKEKEKHPIGVYMLLECKSCGELKEIKTMFENQI